MDQSGQGGPPPSGGQPPQQGWQSTPQQPGPPPPPPPAAGGPPPMGQPGGMGSGMPSWTNNITARGTISGPAGLALADLPDRIIAWVIDGIILSVAGYIVALITTSVLGDNLLGFLGIGTYKTASVISVIVALVIMLAASGAYFWYMWTQMGGASIGMKVMKVSVHDATSGGAISQNQALMRWAILWAPPAVFWGLYGWNILTWLVWLLVIVLEIYLIVTTAQSPTRQGFHDKYANTVVAKG
jgi:uncharacterized RDD family membrane protein YckC